MNHILDVIMQKYNSCWVNLHKNTASLPLIMSKMFLSSVVKGSKIFSVCLAVKPT